MHLVGHFVKGQQGKILAHKRALFGNGPSPWKAPTFLSLNEKWGKKYVIGCAHGKRKKADYLCVIFINFFLHTRDFPTLGPRSPLGERKCERYQMYPNALCALQLIYAMRGFFNS